MTAKKLPKNQEPFLNTVARKLGHAAGTLTNVAHELTENLSAFPERASERMRQGAATGTPAVGRTRHPKKKESRSAAGRQKPKAIARLKNKKRTLAANKSPRSSRKSAKRKAKKAK